MRALRLFLVAVFVVALTACEASDSSTGSDSAAKSPSKVEGSPSPTVVLPKVDLASLYANIADRQVKKALPKGWEEVYSDVSVHGSSSVLTYVYKYRADYPLWKTVLPAAQRKVIQRYCDGVIEPEMKDFGIKKPKVSYLYLHPKAPKMAMTNKPTRKPRYLFAVPAEWGPNPKPRIADRFMCK